MDSRIKPKNLPEMAGRPKIPPRSMMKYWEECCRRRGLVACGGEGISFAGTAETAPGADIAGTATSDALVPLVEEAPSPVAGAAADRSAAAIAQESMNVAENGDAGIVPGPRPTSVDERRRSSDQSSLHAFDELLLDEADIVLMDNGAGGAPGSLIHWHYPLALMLALVLALVLAL